MLITFQSLEIRDEMIKEPRMNLWFENVKPWRGKPASLERFMWLSCKGVPLSVCNTFTFNRIADCWGSLILIDEQTLRDTSFADWRMLIVTKEMQLIDKWINIKTRVLDYDVRIVETSSFGNPAEVEALQLKALQFQSRFNNGVSATGVFRSNKVIEEVGEVDFQKEKVANENRGIGGGYVQYIGATADSMERMLH